MATKQPTHLTLDACRRIETRIHQVIPNASCEVIYRYAGGSYGVVVRGFYKWQDDTFIDSYEAWESFHELRLLPAGSSRVERGDSIGARRARYYREIQQARDAGSDVTEAGSAADVASLAAAAAALAADAMNSRRDEEEEEEPPL